MVLKQNQQDLFIKILFSFFKTMNNWIIVVVVILSVILVIGLSFNNIDNYVTWGILLNEIDQSKIYFIHEQVTNNTRFLPTITSIDYINEDTIEMKFNKNGFFMGDYEIPNEFELVKKVKLGDKFIVMCHDSDADKVFNIDILHLTKLNNTHSVFDHYSGILPPKAECLYPEIIEQSFDIKWDEQIFDGSLKLSNDLL